MSSRAPTLWSSFRQTMGRALRETGQALDRVGVRGETHALATRIYGDDPSVFDDHLSRHRHLMPLLKRGQPLIAADAAYLAPCSTLIGSVQVGKGASIWYGAILRADQCSNGRNWKKYNNGTLTSLQEGKEVGIGDNDEDQQQQQQQQDKNQQPWEIENDIHNGEYWGGAILIGENSNVQDGCVITSRVNHTVIGDGVTIGHSAQIHSATVGDYALIGMGSVLCENSIVQSEAFVAAGAVIGPGVTVPAGELWAGNPARKLRDLTSEERAKLHYQSEEYVKVARGQSGVMEIGGNIPEDLVQYNVRL
mmetsp:Transcript_24605/g.34724  ORF Transcript_24605/g.34724 Transcript_24605/m.34724 type:complete len:307 (-) Transcript_24605:337-1257(-)